MKIEERRRALEIVKQYGWAGAVLNDCPGQVTRLENTNPYYNNAFLRDVCDALYKRLLSAAVDPLTALEQFVLDAFLEHIAATR